MQTTIDFAIKEIMRNEGNTDLVKSFYAGQISGMRKMATYLGYKDHFNWHEPQEQKKNSS